MERPEPDLKAKSRWLFQFRTSKDKEDAPWPKSADFAILEKKLEDPCAAPITLPLDFLKSVTRDFSKELELGRGGFGVVCKGLLRNGKAIAVKKLCNVHLDDGQFHNEVTDFIGLKHKNIVQLIGYCAKSRSEAVEISRGKYVMAEKHDRLICFEYLKNKSLDNYISAESSGLDWHIRFEIIKGICCGLHYLHKDWCTVHLDLKPQNILMDDNMVPKIADFGMSRLFGEQQSRIITQSRGGTFGYMAPEYLNNGLISTKSDIFSLGVIIIELLIGSRDYPKSMEACFEHFAENVVKKWRKRLEETLNNHIRLEMYGQQVNACIMIGRRCVDSDPKKRPAAWDIIEMLSATEGAWEQVPCRERKATTSGRGSHSMKLIFMFTTVFPDAGWLEWDRKGGGGMLWIRIEVNGLFSYGGARSPGRSASMEDFSESEIRIRVGGGPVGMFGVFDGHGSGVAAAQYAKHYLFMNLIFHPKFVTDTKAAIAETYNDIDSEILQDDTMFNAGSTALIAIIIGDRLVVANLGDSRGVICKGGQAIAVSRDHTPEQSDERQRIQDTGGLVACVDGTWVVDGVAEVSRAFGYKHLKKYIVADPEIMEEVVDSSLEFLILATDGLWKVVTNEEAVAMAKPIQDPQQAAKRLVEEAFQRGSSDNITVIIVHFLGATKEIANGQNS